MKVRFLADADLNKAIVTGVLRRDPSLDFLTAQAAGLRGMKDPAVLALAAKQQRVLVSHDAGTRSRHFDKFREEGNSSSGIFLIPQSLELGMEQSAGMAAALRASAETMFTYPRQAEVNRPVPKNKIARLRQAQSSDSESLRPASQQDPLEIQARSGNRQSARQNAGT